MSMRHGSGSLTGKGALGGVTSSSSFRGSSGRHSSSGGGSYGGSLIGGHGGSNVCVGAGGGSGFGGGVGLGGGSGFGGGVCFGGGSGFGDAAGSGVGAGGYGGSFGSWEGQGSGYGFADYEGLLSGNDKMKMQHLNGRLALYIKNVNDLGQVNQDLEKKINHWYETNGPKPVEDYSHNLRIIMDLNKQILEDKIDNAKAHLQIDNAGLTADDFRLKYESEAYLRQCVEGDINGLKKMLDNLTLLCSDAETQLENGREDLVAQKKNHEEEIKVLKQQVGITVNVGMNMAPGIDLQKVLNDTRQEYESIIAKNQAEIEKKFQEQTDEVNKQMTHSNQEIKTVQTEAIELKRTIQTLQIDLQSQLSLKAALESSLHEIQQRYCIDLAKIQDLIHRVEGDLSGVRSDITNQEHEYSMLLDVKSHLDKEIAIYHNLLDGSGDKIQRGSSNHSYSSNYSSGSQPDSSGGLYHVRTRIEDGDGRVVSSHDQHLQRK